MGHGIIPYAELISGLVCLALALALYSPMKRYYATRQPVEGTPGKGGTDAIILAWASLVAAGVILMIYPLT